MKTKREERHLHELDCQAWILAEAKQQERVERVNETEVERRQEKGRHKEREN